MVYYRIKPEGALIKKEDYIHGFGYNTSHYNTVLSARIKHNELHPENRLPVRNDFKEDWDTRTGFNIENKPFHTRFHPLQELRLLEKESGKIYVVDSVHKHHYFGYYIVLLIRAEGTNSHGSIVWENISCFDPSTLENLAEAKNRFEIL